MINNANDWWPRYDHSGLPGRLLSGHKFFVYEKDIFRDNCSDRCHEHVRVLAKEIYVSAAAINDNVAELGRIEYRLSCGKIGWTNRHAELLDKINDQVSKLDELLSFYILQGNIRNQK